MEAGGPGAIGPGGVCDDDVRAVDVQLEPGQRKGPAGGARLGIGVWRHRAAAGWDVGVPYGQPVWGRRVLLVWCLLDLVLGAERVLCEADRGQSRAFGGLVPAGVGV